MNSFEKTDAKAKFFEIRALIESGNFQRAIQEIDSRFKRGLRSYPLIALLLVNARKHNAYAVIRETLVNFKTYIGDYLEQPKQEIWISNILIEEIYLQEGKLVKTEYTYTWALHYVRKILTNSSQSPSVFLSFIQDWDKAQLGKTWHYFYVHALKAMKMGNSKEAAENYIASFELASDEKFPIEEFLIFLIRTYGKTLNSNFSPVKEILDKIMAFVSEYKSANVEDLLSHFLQAEDMKNRFSICVRDDFENMRKFPDQGIFKGLSILSSDPYRSFTANRQKSLFYAPGRLGKFAYFVESDRCKREIREAPFLRNEIITKEVKEMFQVEIEDLLRFEAPKISRRLIVNPGRVGSTLLHKMLRAAGAESVSETWGDWMLPELTWKGVISQEEALQLSRIETNLLFDDEEYAPGRIIKKLPGKSSIYIDALLDEDDDAVFLFRDLEGYFSSRRRLGATPTMARDGLINALVAFQQIKQREKLAGIVWYADLVSNDFSELDSLFNEYVLRPISAYKLDSQANTHLSRENLEKFSPKFGLDEFWRSWNESEGPALVEKLNLEQLIEGNSKVSNLKSKPKQKSIIEVIPGNRWGSIKHYYHFLLGLFLPFVSEEMHESTASKFTFPNCGFMNRHLIFLNELGFDIEIADERSHLSKFDCRTYIGWDHESLYRYAQIEKTTDFIRNRLKLTKFENEFNPKIVIVNRSVSKLKEDDFDSYGIDRRATPNLFELKQELEKNWEVHFVQLEEMSLLNQIKLFRSADVVVAQHGAALANLVWCQQQTRVFEISDNQIRTPAFEMLSRRMNLDYTRVPQASSHSNVDIHYLLRLIEKSN
jgi:hypothetical protein